MAHIRTFIAIELPGVVTQLVTTVTQRLSMLSEQVKWVKVDGVHLTLNFLGDVSAEIVPDVVKAVQNVGQKQSPFTLSVDRLGGFASLEQARVLWLGVNGDTEALATLHRNLTDELTPLGFEPERRKFFPHITLGRARRQPVSINPYTVGPIQPIHFRVDHLTVFKSELHPQGAKYTPQGFGLLQG